MQHLFPQDPQNLGLNFRSLMHPDRESRIDFVDFVVFVHFLCEFLGRYSFLHGRTLQSRTSLLSLQALLLLLTRSEMPTPQVLLHGVHSVVCTKQPSPRLPESIFVGLLAAAPTTISPVVRRGWQNCHDCI